MTAREHMPDQSHETTREAELDQLLQYMRGSAEENKRRKRENIDEEHNDIEDNESSLISVQFKSKKDILEELDIILPENPSPISHTEDAIECAIIAHTRHSPQNHDEPEYRHFELQFTPDGLELFRYFGSAITNPENNLPMVPQSEAFPQTIIPATDEDVQQIFNVLSKGNVVS